MWHSLNNIDFVMTHPRAWTIAGSKWIAADLVQMKERWKNSSLNQDSTGVWSWICKRIRRAQECPNRHFGERTQEFGSSDSQETKWHVLTGLILASNNNRYLHCICWVRCTLRAVSSWAIKVLKTEQEVGKRNDDEEIITGAGEHGFSQSGSPGFTRCLVKTAVPG